MTASPTSPTPPDQWVELYGDYLFRYALMRLKNPTNAEDAVQETLIAGIKNFDSFDGKVDIKFWLRGILRNKIVDHIRKAVRETPIDDREDSDIMERLLFKASGVPSTNPTPWNFNPRDFFDREEFWQAFQSCMSKMKGPVQQAFTLRMLNDLTTEETCKVMDVEPNYLWVLLHRGRSQLKQCLESNWLEQESH